MFQSIWSRSGLLLAISILPSCASVSSHSTAEFPLSSEPEIPIVSENQKKADILQVSHEAETLTRIPETAPPALEILDSMSGEDTIGLPELNQLALKNNPALSEVRARMEALRGKCQQAGLKPNPRLGYSGQQLGSNGIAEQNGIYLEQEFIRGNKLGLDQAVVRQEINQTKHLFEVQKHRVLTDVKVSYYEVLSAQKRQELAEELVRISEQAERIANSLFEDQESSKQDVLQARIDHKRARNLASEAVIEYETSWKKLAAAIGLPYMVPKQLEGALEVLVPKLEWEQALKQITQNSPEIAAANSEVERARWVVNRACAEATPDLNVQAVIQDDNATGSSNGALLVSIPLPVINRNQGGIRQAQSDLVAARRAVDRVKLGFQHRLAPVYAQYLAGRKKVTSYQEGILQDATESLELTRKGYEAGEVNFLEFLTTQRTYFQINLDYIEALQQTWTATAKIEGLLLSNSLEQRSVWNP